MITEMSTRARLVTSLLVLLVAGLVVVVVLRILQAGDPGRLDDVQWRRLSKRFAQRYRPQAQPTSLPVAAAVVATPVPVTRVPQPEPDAEVLARQAAQYIEDRPKSVVELQQFRRTQQMSVRESQGREGVASLVNLNPKVNEWYLLTLEWGDGSREQYHLANARPRSQDLELDPGFPGGIVLVDTAGRTPCDLLWGTNEDLAELARQTRTPVLALCGDRVVLRLPTAGNKTALEWSTDFLRDNVWGGEKLTVLVRKTLFKDAFLATSELGRPSSPDETPETLLEAGAPPPLRVARDKEGLTLEPVELGITLDAEDSSWLTPGLWYPVQGSEGIWVSVMQPGLVAPEILAGFTDLAKKLDEVEHSALVFLVAFDLARFDLGFSVGTDHPRLGWSERVREEVRDNRLPGPDGIDRLEPLVATGMVPTAVADRIVATFTGGFKRGHGAFSSSPLAFANHGSHYGFVESGVVLSKLQPGLATLLVTVDGSVEMRTWTEEDTPLLQLVRHARQNGVPLVEPDEETGEPRPGALVSRWGLGNWSGSQDRRLRTLRAGACLLQTTQGRFLVYGYFSSATPNAMARVFQACGCSYAMQLDINALEHTYLALYQLQDNQLAVEHLVTGMSVLDKQVAGQVLPRFLGFADNRDFFYLLRKSNGEATQRRPVGTSGPRSEGSS